MPTLTAAPLSQVHPGPGLRWVWPNYLPRGKLALLDGDPGVGKSLLAIDLAARLSRGGPLPDGSVAGRREVGPGSQTPARKEPGSQTPATGRPHTTLFLSAEDDAADTTRPRAEAAGADLNRIIVADTAGTPLSFPAHIPDLEGLIRAHAADLVVIDPLMAFLPPDVAANSDPCVRRGLAPLAALAARTGCAILLIRHLRKLAAAKALYRGLGSVGIIAAVRTGWLAARHPADPGLGVLAVTKANLAGAVPSLAYRIAAAGGRAVVEWAGPADVAADGLGVSPPTPLRPRDRAAEWLRAKLANGPRRSGDLYAAAAGAGIPDRTLERAKADLNVLSHQIQGKHGNEWWWYDPAAPWPKKAPFKKPFELPPLPPL